MEDSTGIASALIQNCRGTFKRIFRSQTAEQGSIGNPERTGFQHIFRVTGFAESDLMEEIIET